MKIIIYLLFALVLSGACTKDKVTPPVTTEEEKEEEDEPTPPKEPEEHYVKKKSTLRQSEYYFDSQSSTDLYLGSIWNLKDTSNYIQLENLNFPYSPFPIWYLPNAPGEPENMIPSYNAMMDYVTRNGETTVGGFNSGSSTFFDYAEVGNWLASDVDTKTFLDLATYRDSTITRKPFTTVLQMKATLFELYSDVTDFQHNFTEKYIDEVLALGRSPYYVSYVTYGKHYIIMAESDSSRVNLNTTLKKLMEEVPLSTLEENVLTASKVLIYLRTGKKKSFIEKGEGVQGIKNMFNRFNSEWRDVASQYDYPLSYALNSLNDFQTLRHYRTFDFLVKEKRNPEQ